MMSGFAADPTCLTTLTPQPPVKALLWTKPFTGTSHNNGATMTVDPSKVVNAILHQGHLLETHEMHLTSLDNNQDALTAMI